MAAACAAAHTIPPRPMINAERILLALDSRLNHSVSLVLYGRAALALGFEGAPDKVSRSLDVDAIIPVSQAVSLREDQNFWDASLRSFRGENPVKITFIFSQNTCCIGTFACYISRSVFPVSGTDSITSGTDN